VAGQIKQTEGAVGYVEQVYAQQNQLSTAAVRNQGGQYVAPTVEATTAAVQGAAGQLAPEAELTISLVNAPGAQAYPISSLTYLLVPARMEECTKAKALTELVRWAISEGDEMARQLGYAPLPENVQAAALGKLQGVTCGPNNQPAS
jgi:phosphate transport system substrate-binding protein